MQLLSRHLTGRHHDSWEQIVYLNSTFPRCVHVKLSRGLEKTVQASPQGSILLPPNNVSLE